MNEKKFSWKLNKINIIMWIILSLFYFLMNTDLLITLGLVNTIIVDIVSGLLIIYFSKLILFIILFFKKNVRIIND